MVLEYFEREDINEFFDVFARDYKKARTWLVDNICMLETLLPEMAKDLGLVEINMHEEDIPND